MNKHKNILISGEYYHVYSRGNNKERIFFIERDYYRLLTTLLLFQSSFIIKNVARITDSFYRKGFTAIDGALIQEIVDNRTVELIAFVLMPNHFHLLIRQLEDGGVTAYMQRALTSYTKYINTRHKRTGHIFQGNFGRVRISNNDQLLYLSTYIHRNPRELHRWSDKEDKYPWSSYQDFIITNRWGGLLIPNIVTDQFPVLTEYRKFTESSMAKRHEVLD